MKIVVRSILMERERKRLEEVAHKRGFDSCAIMLHDMYVVQEIPIEKISKLLYTPMWSLRKRFSELGIGVKSRGGKNHVRFEMTQELYNEVCRDGVMTVADRLGIDALALNTRIKRWYVENVIEKEKQG